MRKSLRFEHFAALVCLAGVALLVSTESLAQRKGGRGRQQINRSGPASHGSYGRTTGSRRNDGPRRSPPQSDDRVPRAQAREAVDNHDRRDQAVNRQRTDRNRAPDRDDYQDRDRDDYRDRDDHRDRDRDYVVRRRRIWYRGDQITYVEYRNYGCGEDVVIVDGDKYYQCEGTWFVRTYYGGELVYYVTDPPSGY